MSDLKFVVKAEGRKRRRWTVRIRGRYERRSDMGTGIVYKGVFLTKAKAMIKVGQLKRNTNVSRVIVEMIDSKDKNYYTSGRQLSSGVYYTDPRSVAYYSHHEKILDWERAEEGDEHG